MASKEITFTTQRHGKSKVRLGRVWREGSVHDFVEWNVDIGLLSDCVPAYTKADNSALVATDTMKNTVYVLGKQCDARISPEAFALLVAKHFINTYKVVTGAKVSIVEKPWERVVIDGKPHDHGFKLGMEKHTVAVEVDGEGKFSIVSGISEFALLKTTQSGFEGFIRDKYTLLPDTRERIVASSVCATWKYSGKPKCFSATYTAVKETMAKTFFGPSTGGTYSPSVQNTLYLMAQAVLEKFPEIESVYLNMPNLHFLPMNMPGIGLKFADDVYLPTSEPHGTIEATLTRGQPTPFKSRL